jgi:cytochrome c oxidase assembly factor CtaG
MPVVPPSPVLATPAPSPDHGYRRRVSGAVAAGLGGALSVLAPGLAAAHGPVPADPPTLANLALGWSFEPFVAIPLLVAAAGWLALVRRVRRLHPSSPVPALRTAAFLGGLAAIAVALLSGFERYDTTLFSVHMGQHLLLMLVAAPLICLAAPVTQVLRAASPAARRRVLLPVLHSTVAGVLGHPVVAWLAFTIVAWASHFSPLFDLALENEAVHTAEHVAFLTAGLLFWWPVVAADPAPRRLTYPVRALYLLLQMPPSSFLGMAILFAAAPLYPHYASLGAPYGIDPLADQQLAGGIMWLAGDVVLIGAILAVVAAWMRHEERDAPAAERRADAARARLRERADQLARTRGPGGDADADL